MMFYIEMDHRTGKPPVADVYVVTFRNKPRAEVFSYWDGKSWGHPEPDPVLARHGCPLGGRLPFYKRHWWTSPLYYRVIGWAKVSPKDALKSREA